MKPKSKKALLILENGAVFHGVSFGSEENISAEIVFNTGMMGYPESLTDPSYKGQILVFTFPLIGNYGVPSNEVEDNLLKNFESDKIQAAGLIISDYSHDYSHWNAEKSLSEWLKEHKIPALYGVDTRALTKILREKGTMQGKIIFSKKNKIKHFNPDANNFAEQSSAKEKTIYGNGKTKILLIDCGVKNSIIRHLIKRKCTVIKVPWDYDFSDEEYDGLFISNGPGNPKLYKKAINSIKKCLNQNKPIFGICLGNQLLSLASGANTYKLKYGHRSQNQPCIMNGTMRCFITSQNHGYAVDAKTLKKDWVPFFTNANDSTNEGIKHKSKPFFSCQFHPEACCGPKDTEFLFDYFIDLVNKKNKTLL